MLKKIFVLVILFTAVFTAYGQDTKKEEKKPKPRYKTALDSLLLEGIQAINDLKTDEAVKLLNEALALDPKMWEIHYEKALAYFQIREIDSVISILEPWKDSLCVNNHFYQILGSSYDIKKEYEKAVETYKKGLERFPNAGNIYMEMGVHHFELKETLQAVALWHKGIDVQPEYDFNYFWLSRYFFYNYDYVWTIMYGELFMLLSEAPTRIDDISTYINGAYGYGFYHEVDSVNTEIKFTGVNIKAKNLEQREDLPFEMAFQMVMKEAADTLLPKKKADLKIDDIYKIRKAFIEIWYRDGWNKRYSNPLFDLHKKMIENKHFDTYTYWLFNSVRKPESQEWLKSNQQKLQDFGNFMVKNKLKINKGNYFTKDKYARGF